MNKDIYRPAIWGGLFIFVATVVPGINIVNCMCGAGIIGGGIFSVYMYRRSIGLQTFINAKTGVKLGLISGLIGAILSFIVFVVVMRVFNLVSYDLSLDSTNDIWSDWLALIDPYLISKFALLLSFAASLIFNILLATVGGLIGVSLFGQGTEKKKIDVRKKQSGDTDRDGIVVENDSHY